jgi:hypothetical protein
MIIEERGVGGHRLEFKEGILSGVVSSALTHDEAYDGDFELSADITRELFLSMKEHYDYITLR